MEIKLAMLSAKIKHATYTKRKGSLFSRHLFINYGKKSFIIYPKSGNVRTLELTCPIGQRASFLSCPNEKLTLLRRSDGPSFLPSMSNICLLLKMLRNITSVFNMLSMIQSSKIKFLTNNILYKPDIILSNKEHLQTVNCQKTVIIFLRRKILVGTLLIDILSITFKSKWYKSVDVSLQSSFF